MQFREEKAAMGNRGWSKVDARLYSSSFTGWGKYAAWCDCCTSLDHDRSECPYNREGRPPPSVSPYNRESRPSSAIGQLGPMGKSQETCRKYNRFDGIASSALDAGSSMCA